MKDNLKYKHLIVLIFLCMAIFGFIENIKGTIIPSIRNQFAVDYSSIGIMLLISSFGYLISTLVSGLVADRLGKKVILIIGFIFVISAAILFYYTNSFAMTVILLLLISAGFGCFEVVINSLGAQIFVTNSAVMMNLTHLFYGLGSSISPKYAGSMLVRSVSWNHVYTTTLVILVPVLIYLVFLRFPETNKDSANNKLPIGQMVKDKKIWLIVGTLGFCGVLEMGMANWLVNFLQEVRGISVDQSSLYMTFFFVTFMLGRLFGGHIAERLGYAKIILYFAIISIVIFACGMVLNNSFIFLFSCIGFFVSIMFPTIMSIIMKEYPSSTSSVMGFIISINGGINMTFNWIIGKTNDLLNVNMGFGSLIIYAVLIVVFVIPLGKRLTYDKKGNEEMIIYNSN